MPRFNIRKNAANVVVAAALLLGVGLLTVTPAFAADIPSISLPSTTGFDAIPNLANPLTGIQITDAWAGSHSGTMNLYVSSLDGSISMTGAQAVTPQLLHMTGSLAKLNGALATLTYTPSGHKATDTITVHPWNQAGKDARLSFNINVAALTSSETLYANLAAHANTSVKNFGAKGDGVTDDTAAIQKTLSQAPAGSIVLLPPGHYIVSKTLNFTQSEMVLVGENATLVATTPTDQTLYITGNHSAVVNVSFQGTGKVRQSNPASTKIQVSGNYDQVIGNNIDGSGSVGIFVYKAQHFLIQNNTVKNTLADGIHMTGPSNYGVVTGNTVTATGDDQIAVVSYKGSGAQALAPDSNILITGNTVSGGLARGITVVGGENVTITGNTISDIPYAAGIYIADEVSQYGTLPVSNILVQNNTISNIEMVAHPAGSSWTHQAAINLYTGNGGNVQNVMLKNNNIVKSALEGIRLDASCHHNAAMNDSSGACVMSNPSGGYVCSNVISDNMMTNTNGGINAYNSADCAPADANVCAANMLNGVLTTSNDCLGTAIATVTGSNYTAFGQGSTALGSWAGSLPY